MSNISKEEWNRYERQIQLPGVGTMGQSKIKNASVLVVGAGGLGCPALIYLASAGIGMIGIADHDTVSESNLHRQPLYKHDDIGALKSTIATQRVLELNPHIQVISHDKGLSPDNAINIISSYDIVLDCTDRFDARYLINDACVLLDKPIVHGSLFRYQAQLATFNHLLPDRNRSATYRCVFPKPPTPSETTDCKVAGVFGFLPGIIGSWMAGETIKMILGNPINPELLILDIQKNTLQKLELTRSPESWGNTPRSMSEISAFDYGAFCSRLT